MNTTTTQTETTTETHHNPPALANEERSTRNEEPSATPTMLVLDIETAPFPPELLKKRGFAKVPRSYSAQTPRAFIQTEEQYWQQWHDETAQLDPGRSYVCAIGLLWPGVAARFGYAENPGEERGMIEAIQDLILGVKPFGENEAGEEVYLDPDRTIIVGHNVRKFDLPYLAGRDLIAGTNRKAEVYGVADTKEAWEARYKTGGNSSSLDSIAATLGLPTKPGAGKDFWTWPKEQRQEYLLHDLMTTAEVARRIGVIPG